MKAPLEWLKDFTEIDIPTHDFCERMTISGSKVEAIITNGEEISNVFTGRVLTRVPHPDSDHLQILTVDMGSEALGGTLQIVCGAPNVTEGMICPVAIPGATLPGGHTIKRGVLRGVESAGMCCSIQELGFAAADFEGASDNGLWHLPDTAEIGVDIKKYLGIGGQTIDFEITSNRPDCFSIEGLGREAAITLEKPFHAIFPKVEGSKKTPSPEIVKVDISSPELCFRYCARIVSNLKIEPSPDWMQRRLRDAGMRPINTIVDITNYVCLELGQPMHAFDLDYLSGNHIIVRTATEGETIKTLDGVDRILDSQALVIADEEKVCAIAGIMGGENSEVLPTTSTILFESAVFDAVSVRKTAVRNGLRTEASSRYEKGLDPQNALRALERACELVELLQCGTVHPGVIDSYPTKKPAVSISFTTEKINAFLGTAISQEYMVDILERLECRVDPAEGELVCVPPSFRPDLECFADIAEEIARFYGYNNIEPTLLSGKETTPGGRTQNQKTLEKMKDVLVAQGYFEAITYSFESPKDLDRLGLDADDSLRRQIVISNPLGEDYSVMRTSMAPTMLRIASTNSNRSVDKASVFEIAFVYLPSLDPGQLPNEKRVLSAFSYDSNEKEDAADSFFAAKGAIVELCAHLGIKSFSFEPLSTSPYLHPGRAATITINGRFAGTIGYIHPRVAEQFECPNSVVLFELDADLLLNAATSKRTSTPLPRYPGIARDLAVIMDKDIPVGKIEKILKRKGGKYLESYELFDVYTGKQIGENQKSVAYSLLFRSPNGTLKDSDIQGPFGEILETLEKELGAQLR